MIDEKKPNFNNRPHRIEKSSMPYEPSNKLGDPLISIVTPFYNTGEIFHETAACILNQSFQQFEWIIVNDGSTVEESLTILQNYSILDKRIRVINHDSNCGLSTARNTGISNSKAEFILFIDSDDLIEPTAAEKWFWFLSTHPKINFVDSYHVVFGEMNYLWTGGFHDRELNIDQNRISMLCMVRKSVFLRIGGFDETIRGGLEDWDFWLKCASNGIWGDTIPEFLAWYRVRKDHTDRWENLSVNNLNLFKERIKNKYPNLLTMDFPDVTNIVDLDLTIFEVRNRQINLLKKENKNLLIILPWLVMGGAERFTLNLIRQLSGKNWNTSIITTSTSNNEWKSEFEDLTKDVFILPDFLNIVDYVDFINYLIFSRGIDVVFLQGSIEGYRLLPIIRNSNPGLIIVDYLHFITEDWMKGGFPKLSYLYHDYLDKSIVSCKQVKDWMVNSHIDENKIEVCYIGVDPNVWKHDIVCRNEFRNKLSIRPDEFVLLYAARLEEQKQPLLLIETLHILKSEGVNLKTLIAGDGSLRRKVETKIKESDLTDNVFLLGAISSSEMPDFLNAGDLFFLPSENEGVSSALYEAMATGLPVVGSKVGGQIELVTKECGFLIDKEINEPAKKYSELIKELYYDSEKRKKMSSSCKNRIESEFTINLMGDCINSTLINLLQVEKEKNQNGHRPIFTKIDKYSDQLTVEYLQARNEWIKLNNNLNSLLEKQENITYDYMKLIEPKPPSYWFYLWIRQLFMPLNQRFIENKLVSDFITVIKNFLKKIILRE